MVSRRLTRIDKIEILEEFRSGETANNLSKKYNCSANTINRTVKTLLTKEEYILLKEKRLKIKKTKIKEYEIHETNKESEVLEDGKCQLKYSLDSEDDKIDLKYKNNNIDHKIRLESNNIKSFPNDKADVVDLDSNYYENKFEEIVPLLSSFGFDTKEQKVDCKNLDMVTLPDSLYMLVDKKIELESSSISDLPEWSFLPESELERRAILLFPNKRSASRNCSKNQKVLKIPDTGIFKISKPYLLSKGITRLIIEDSLISLEN